VQLRIGRQDHQGRRRGKGARSCASERGRASLLPRVMPRPKRDPYYYRRKGRKGFFAFIDSEHKHIPLHTDDPATASERLAEHLRGRGQIPSPGAQEKRLEELWEICFRRSQVNDKPRTTRALHQRLAAILDWLERHDIFYATQISTSVVEAFKANAREREKPMAPATVNRHMDAWRRGMKVAIEFGYVTEDCFRFFKRMREPRAEPHRRGLSRRELTAFLKAVKDERYRALFRMVLGSGIRDDEARYLDDANLRADELVVTPKPGWTTKNYRYRAIPISTSTYKAATSFLAAKSSMNLDQKRIWLVIQEACEAAGVPRFSMHDLRRAWASHMLDAGTKIERISHWLGHADVMTTMRYLRIVDESPVDRKKLPW
jgi:integrase